MEPLPGYDAWLTNEDLLEERSEESDEEQARYVDSQIDADREREP